MSGFGSPCEPSSAALSDLDISVEGIGILGREGIAALALIAPVGWIIGAALETHFFQLLLRSCGGVVRCGAVLLASAQQRKLDGGYHGWCGAGRRIGKCLLLTLLLTFVSWGSAQLDLSRVQCWFGKIDEVGTGLGPGGSGRFEVIRFPRLCCLRLRFRRSLTTEVRRAATC